MGHRYSYSTASRLSLSVWLSSGFLQGRRPWSGAVRYETAWLLVLAVRAMVGMMIVSRIRVIVMSVFHYYALQLRCFPVMLSQGLKEREFWRYFLLPHLSYWLLLL